MTNETGKKPVMHKKHVARLEREQQQTRLILYTFFGILAAVVLLLIYGWLDINYLQLNKPVAKVGDSKIVLKDFEARVKLRRQQLIDNFIQYQTYQQYGIDMTNQLQSISQQLDSPTTVGESVLNEMIDEEIIRQEAAKRGITVSEEELNQRMEEGFGFFVNGTPTPSATPTLAEPPTEPADILKFLTPTPDVTATPLTSPTAESTATLEATAEGATAEATATATLAPTATATLVPTATATQSPTETPFPTSTPFTREGYETVVANTNKNLDKYGLSEDFIRAYFTNLILHDKLEEAITADEPSTNVKLRARHILVADEATAKEIITKLQNGADFAELARQYSTDTGSGAQGGDLGWFGKNEMVPEFETAAYALEKPGDFTTEPVKSQFGYHIIQLLGKMESPMTASELKTAKDVAFRKWLDAARAEGGDYKVETFDIWQARVPTTPNFQTAATEAVEAQKTSQAEQVSTLDAAKTLTPKP